jgi:hypothetical protein
MRAEFIAWVRGTVDAALLLFAVLTVLEAIFR